MACDQHLITHHAIACPQVARKLYVIVHPATSYPEENACLSLRIQFLAQDPLVKIGKEQGDGGKDSLLQSG